MGSSGASGRRSNTRTMFKTNQILLLLCATLLIQVTTASPSSRFHPSRLAQNRHDSLARGQQGAANRKGMGKHIDPIPSHMPMESPDMVDDAIVEDDDTVEQDTESPNVLEMGDTGIGNSNAGIDTAEMDNAGMDSAEMHNPGEVLIDEDLDPIDEEIEEDDGATDVNGEEIHAPVDPEMESEEDLALSDSDVAIINQLFI